MERSLLIFILCLVPRLIYLFVAGEPAGVTENFYWILSGGLLRTGTLSSGGVPTTDYEPLYPVFLAFSRWAAQDRFWLVMTFQSIVASLAAILLFRLAFALTQNRRIAWLTTAFYIVYPYYIRQSSALIEVALFTFALIACALLYLKADQPRYAPAAGAAFGLTLLLRTTAAPLWLAGVAALILRRRFVPALLLAGTTLLIVSPVLLRNARLNGSFYFTRSGINLFEANCEHSGKVIPAYSTDLLNPYAYAVLREEAPELVNTNGREHDAFYTRKALAFMKENPLQTLKLRFLYLASLFHPRIVPFHPFSKETRIVFDDAGRLHTENVANRPKIAEWAHALSYSFIFFTALYGVWLRRGEIGRDAPLHFITLSFILVYTVYWPATRLRAPMDFVLMFYSAVSVHRWLPRA